jgi:tRNA modification GTPase
VAPAGEIARKIIDCRKRLEGMAETFQSGRLYRDGVSVVIVGKPNVGKSSLFNALLRDNRAIVTAVPGTTRDFLEESLTIGGVLFRLTDTAGIRESSDPVEEEGIRRSRRAMEHADILLVVRDASSPSGEGSEIVSGSEDQRSIVVWNKIDTVSASRIIPPEPAPADEVRISAKNGEGVHELSELLVRLIGSEKTESAGGVQVIAQRHWSSLSTAIEKMNQALRSIDAKRTNEFVAFDVRESIAALGEITGAVTSEDVLNSIFSSFCIGK